MYYQSTATDEIASLSLRAKLASLAPPGVNWLYARNHNVSRILGDILLHTNAERVEKELDT